MVKTKIVHIDKHATNLSPIHKTYPNFLRSYKNGKNKFYQSTVTNLSGFIILFSNPTLKK